MSRRMMSKGTSGGTTKGHQKGNRRTTSSQVQPPITNQQTLISSKEHNNNIKSNPVVSTHQGSSVVVPQPNNNKNPPPQSNQQQSSKQQTGVKILKDKNHHLEKEICATSTTTIPPAPSSSPTIPLELEDDIDGEDLEVDVDDAEEDLDEDDEDLDEDDEEEDLDEDDEYDHEDPHDHDDLTEPCESRTPGAPGGGPPGPATNNSASQNSPIFLGSSEEEDDDEGEVDESLERDESDEDEEDDEDGLEPSGFLLPPDGDPSNIQGIPPDAQARLEAFFEAAGTGFTDGKLMSDPENLRKLTLTVSSALGEASAAINRMRDSQRKSLEEGRNDSMEEGDSLLALACSSGYFELARVLLAMGANVDDRGSKGDLTPLMDAASQGHLEIVKLLISHGADVNAQSACGNSPLMYACSAGHEDIVRELLKAGARVEDNNENGHTPLMEAASSGHVNVAKILLESGAGINTHSNEFKESALTVACYKGHLEMVRFLLAAGADQQHKTDEMHTALMEASMDGHVEVARLLLDCGAQVNMPADSFESPLTLAACGGHVELAELLIERGANIEEVNDEGYTPLMEAAREGHLPVVKCLLKANSKINAETDETHETALTLSSCGGFLDVVDTLCHHGADIEAGASTPLMEASQEGHYQVVKYLLDRGADITRETQTGDTALSYACENGHVDVVELLIEKGADPEHLSEGGRTPLMKACRGGHVDVIKFLLSKGADVNRQTASNDHTPLSLSCAGGHIAAVEVLLAAGANPYHKLKDSSTMIIEAARGGHTNVIRILLDHVPANRAEKSPQGKQQQQAKGSAVNQSGQTHQKAQAIDSSKTCANATQGKSVLRKSRSTSTLDSSQKEQPSNASGSNDVKPKPLPPMTSIPADSPLLKNLNLPLGDGKPQVLTSSTTTSEDTRKKPVPLPSVTVAVQQQQGDKSTVTVPTTTNNTTGGNRKTATPSTSSSTTTLPTNVCLECNAKSPSEQQQQQQPHGHVKRSAAEAVPVSPQGSSSSAAAIPVPSTSSSNNVTSTTGPPLVPSQVTAATAISERPKAKANKPSARKQVQLQQQQIQQQFQNQQQQLLGQNIASPSSSSSGEKAGQGQQIMGSPGVSPSSSSGTSPSGGSVGMLASVAQDYSNRLATAAGSGNGSQSGLKVTTASPPNPSPPYITAPTLLQMQVQQVRGSGKCEVASSSETHFTLDAKQLMQIFTQHHQSQLMYKGEHKFECFEKGINYENTDVIDFAQVLAATAYPPTVSGVAGASGGLNLPHQPSPGGPSNSSGLNSPGGGTTTTTTTTVVVTHGNGDTETIIEGDNLPPGANEMIMSAAAAAFPIDCYSHGGGGLATSATATGGQVQVQSYQLNSPVGLSVGVGELSPLSTTTMHTTTIINSGNNTNFQSQILLPHHHPPPLPAAIQAAAAAAGLVPPSGAPPEGALRQLQQQQQVTQAKSGVTTGKSIPPPSVVTTIKDKVSSSLSSPVKGTVSSTQGTQANSSQQIQQPTATQIQKKQTAKRTRPFSQQGHGACSNNQKSGSQSHSVASTQTPLGVEKAVKALDVDSATDSNGETSLSIAAAQGHYEVVEFLLSRCAHVEHRDKKGCTPLILAADGGHEKVVELLLSANAEIEAQSERTKDTALSLACTKGRYEVVELLLKKQANKEHRNVSDYTPLSLAASGGFVNIIKLLLQYGAEINSRTGSKLGISPLMLAAMNGNTAAVKLLLDMGSDINAQIETNKNTALTLACFQGRHEVVQLLLERKANLEHRAKTGLTPLMEAANGGYVEVGKVLIEKGADVNAPPVPATRDTALTIAADKGHFRFVEMLISCHANVDVRNKKGCTPLWLSCNGGHLDVCQALQRARADVDAQDNRRISCLMAAFKKGHVKVVRWIVKFVKQFPNDTEMSRYFLGLTNEPELLKRAQQCMEYIKQAKDKQALEASKNANILLEELELEKSREESKKLAAAKRREKKKKKKQEKKQQFPQSGDNEDDREDENDDDEDNDVDAVVVELVDSGIDVFSTVSQSSEPKQKNVNNNNNNNKSKGNKENLQNQPSLNKQSINKQSVTNVKNLRDVPPIPQEPEEVPVELAKPEPVGKNRKKKTKGSSRTSASVETIPTEPSPTSVNPLGQTEVGSKQSQKSSEKENAVVKGKTVPKSDKEILKEKVKEVEDVISGKTKKDKKSRESTEDNKKSLKDGESHKESAQYHAPTTKGSTTATHGTQNAKKSKGSEGGVFQVPEPLMGISLNPSQLRKGAFEPHERELSSHGSHPFSSSAPIGKVPSGQVAGAPGPKPGLGRKDDGWKEVTRSCPSSRSKKVIVPSSVISRVIGRGGCNINAIREATNAHIEVEKQQKGQVQPERTIQIKGSVEATKQAYNLITALMNEPDVDIKKLIPQQRIGGVTSTSSNGGVSSGTPTPILNVNAFPIIGSASAPLPPIGQPMTASNSGGCPASSGTIQQQPLNISTTAPVDINKGFTSSKGSHVKGSPTSKTSVLSTSASPPLSYLKSGSPPIKKPTVVQSSSAGHNNNNNSSINFEIGNFSVSEANADVYNKSYPIGKRSMVFTPSASAASSIATSHVTNTVSSSSFASKLSQHATGNTQQQQSVVNVHESQTWDNRQRNATPTLSRVKTPTYNTNVSSTPPPIQNQNAVVINGVSVNPPSHRPQQQQPSSVVPNQNHIAAEQRHPQGHPQQTSVLHSIVQSFGANQGVMPNPTGVVMAKETDVQQVNGPSNVGGASTEPSTFNNNGVPSRNLAPGPSSGGALNSSRSTAGSERSSSEASNQDQQPPPLEYSPFNYTFSKTTGWFPGDLAVREPSNIANPQQSNFGVSNLISSLATGGSTSALSAVRAMNFASVAASGISASMSTTTAQMTQAPIGQGQNGGGNNMASLGMVVAKPEGHHNTESPKADASKAPGYRGNTTMGSPVLRIPQQVPSNIPNSNYNMDGPLSSQFAAVTGIAPTGLNHNNMMGYNQSRPNYGPGQPPSGNQYPQDMGMMNSHQQPMNGGNPIMYQNNRLNPKAPSFMVKVQPGQGQQPLSLSSQQTQQQGSVNSAFASTQQNQFNNLQYKNVSGQQGGMNQQYGGGRLGLSGPGRSNQGNVGSGWTGYGNGNAEELNAYQTLTAVAGPAGMIDPATLLSGIEGLHDNQNAMKIDDRRLPRPIGGERTWKSTSGGSIANMGPYSTMDGMDVGPLNQQPISGTHGSGPPQGNSWLGMYGNSSQQTGYPIANQQQQGQIHGGLNAHGPPIGPGPRSDRGNVLGRRFIEEMDANRILELQQMYDGQQRMMNGGSVPPMMHMPNPVPHPNAGMYQYGLEHLDQHNMPKLDQQWDSHLLMDDKHLQGGWGGNKWGN